MPTVSRKNAAKNGTGADAAPKKGTLVYVLLAASVLGLLLNIAVPFLPHAH